MLLTNQEDLQALASSFFFCHQRKLSISFLQCLNEQVSADFERLTGLRINPKKISFSSFRLDEMNLNYEQVSSFTTRLYVNHNWPRCRICWSSKSGRIYKLEDEIEDCNDVRFWLEEIDIVGINMMMNPEGNPFPIKTNAWGYALEINGLQTDISVKLYLLPQKWDEAESINKSIDEFIDGYNRASEEKGREYGLVHNWKRHAENGVLYFDIDLGSADVQFLGKWLKYLHTMQSFSRVEIE